MLVGSRAIHSRIVRDGSGTVWHVTESSALNVPGAMAPHCLVFDSATVCRRYWRYPVDWSTQSADRLLEFMNQSRQPSR
ncbi:MAG TPA: hypothetical protein VIM15_05840 [Gemmatimonadaceae bacterium]